MTDPNPPPAPTPTTPATPNPPAPEPTLAQLGSVLAALELNKRLAELERARPARGEPLPRVSPWIFGSFIAVGAGIGFLAGMSASPIVGTVVPFLFAFLGGASGLLLAQPGFSPSQAVDRAALVAPPTIGFVVACVFGSIIGVSVRTGAPLSTFFPTASSAAPSVDKRFAMRPGLKERIGYVGYRARVRALGLPEVEESALLDAFVEASAPNTFTMTPWLEQLRRAISAVEAQPTPPSPPEGFVVQNRALVESLQVLAHDAEIQATRRNLAKQLDFVESSGNALRELLQQDHLRHPATRPSRSAILRLMILGDELIEQPESVRPSDMVDEAIPKGSGATRLQFTAPSRSIASESKPIPTIFPMKDEHQG